VPRTATVRAASDLELQALTCNRLLPVVTGFPPSAREAGTSVGEMLDRFNPENRMTINKNRTTIKTSRDTSAEIRWVRGRVP
jgi:hypothetical protein